MRDLASRCPRRLQITTDAFAKYVKAVRRAFGENGVDYAMMVKDFAEGDHRWDVVFGEPDPDHISTSLIERQNLTIRMEMGRFTRLTNGHSKKVENHELMLAIFYAYYNFARTHESLGGRTPAQAAGIAEERWTVADLVGLLEDAARPVLVA